MFCPVTSELKNDPRESCKPELGRKNTTMPPTPIGPQYIKHISIYTPLPKIDISPI